MKKIALVILFALAIYSCKKEPLDPDRFKTGTFEIPAGKGYEKEHIIRKDSIQISTYGTKVDTLSIIWKDNFNYTLKMINPKTAIDKGSMHIKITNIEKNSYDFELVIGHSNYIQKGTIIKID